MKIVMRRKHNKILMLRTYQRDWIEEENDLRNHVNEYCKKLFNIGVGWREWITIFVTFPALQTEEVKSMASQVKDVEVRKALFSMKSWKALGPYGFPTCFYQKSWHTIGESVYKLVKYMWSNPGDVGSINKTDICLLPKVDHHPNIKQFFHISLCNSIYKVVIKVVVDWLKPCISKLVLLFQTVFVSRRHSREHNHS